MRALALSSWLIRAYRSSLKSAGGRFLFFPFFRSFFLSFFHSFFRFFWGGRGGGVSSAKVGAPVLVLSSSPPTFFYLKKNRPLIDFLLKLDFIRLYWVFIDFFAVVNRIYRGLGLIVVSFTTVLTVFFNWIIPGFIGWTGFYSISRNNRPCYCASVSITKRN